MELSRRHEAMYVMLQCDDTCEYSQIFNFLQFLTCYSSTNWQVDSKDVHPFFHEFIIA